MSNEFVMVPRELDVEGARDFYNEHWTGRCEDLWPQLMDYVKAKPAEQHQGDAIGTLRRSQATDYGRIIFTPIGDPHIKDGMQVYTHADPGEVERLRAELEEWKQRCQYNADTAHDVAKERDTLRAQLAELEKLHGGELGLPKEGWPEYHKRKMETLRNLTAGYYERKLAERDALLRELDDAWNSHDGKERFHKLMAKIEALSASAEPSAPVECDERAEFDPLEWLETEIIAVDTWYRGSPSYEHDAGWMKDQALRLVAEARAALERKP